MGLDAADADNSIDAPDEANESQALTDIDTFLTSFQSTLVQIASPRWRSARGGSAPNVKSTERGGYVYGSYGYGYGYRTKSSVMKAVRTQETARAAVEAKAVMEKLRNQLGDARRAMSVRYPDDF